MNCPYCNQREHPGQNCDREHLKQYVADLKHQVFLASAELQANRKIPGNQVIMLQSIVSNRTRTPRVDIQLGEIHTQMEAAAAVNLSIDMLRCATGAYADAFLLNFVMDKIGGDQNAAAQVLVEFRDFRAALDDQYDQYVKGVNPDGHQG